ncbi:MAG TPA: muconolactone Delta-isomerase family protein, partial [Pseudonocardiaceae bacterium]|nr:muconolactone Delta-isomerase family protein [Pseudonocardiaceae bacterium]
APGHQLLTAQLYFTGDQHLADDIADAVKPELLPPDMPAAARVELLRREKEYAQDRQRAGDWLHLWRCAGRYANLSIFDVTDNERLHEILWRLPLFDHLRIDITPLATHPSAINAHQPGRTST